MAAQTQIKTLNLTGQEVAAYDYRVGSKVYLAKEGWLYTILTLESWGASDYFTVRLKPFTEEEMFDFHAHKPVSNMTRPNAPWRS